MRFEDHELERFGLLAGDIVICEGGEAGRAAIWDGRLPELKFQKAIHRVRPSPRLLNRYFVYRLMTDYFSGRLADYYTGATIKHLTGQDLARYEFPLPPLPEQRRIADVLDKADAIRRKRREAMSHSADLPLAIFSEMFGRRTDSVQSARLSTVAEVVSGVTKGRRFNGAVVRSVPYLRVANVQDGYLDLKEIKTIEALPTEIEALALRRGDVVMTEGGDHDKLGRGAIWEHDVPDCIHQNHVFRVRLDLARVLPHYFATYLRTREAKSYFLRCAKKTTNLASINISQLKSLPVPLAPREEQNKFVETLASARRLTGHLQAHAASADNLFHALVQRAFRGEL